jgi:hypothetical protein
VVGCGGDERAPTLAEDETDGVITHPRHPSPSTSTHLDGGLFPTLGELDASTESTPDVDLLPDGAAAPLRDGAAPPSSIPGALAIEMVEPSDETKPEEVYDEAVTAGCRVHEPSGADAGVNSALKLDPSTVVFELISPDDEVLNSLPGAVSEDDATLYEVTFPVQNVDSGRVRLRCRASDASSSPREVSADAQTFIDHGPIVTVINPVEGAPESALGAVAFEYDVSADQLVKGDKEAAIDGVELSLVGRTFTLTERDDKPGVYRTTVDFQDKDIFEEVPTGQIQIAVDATNLRGITHTTKYEFLLDGSGPEVAILAPGETAIIGGKVQLQIQATDDASAIDWNTLVVTLNDDEYPYEENGPWGINGDVATFTFETGDVKGSIEQITVNVLVKDRAGNPSPGTAALYYRDEIPPIVTMNPPNFRAVDTSPTPDACSIPFDPLGIAPEDGQDVPDRAQYRALVWDLTNHAEGSNVEHPSFVNRSSVDLYVRRPDAPLVVDTNDDGQCDDIAEEGTKFQDLTALIPTGSAVYTTMNDDTQAPAIDEWPYGCELVDRTVPPALCAEEASDLTIVVGHAVNKSEPLVYSVSPTDSLECTGQAWELASAGLSNYQGWVCLAVRAYDNVGNRGVSSPIAVCYDNSQIEGEPDCTADKSDKPDCTDGCSAPPQMPPAFVKQ